MSDSQPCSATTVIPRVIHWSDWWYFVPSAGWYFPTGSYWL